ncbi:TetR/AcrR family transcriptional regulator [Phytohabitans flavus]|uniref:TetR family transcriptional regulator n=1 Tax=Phytohabitans flavus TaxID=1076124 RepID=A0A6F8XSC9_9ACTN|nr:TetR/AcrR family transcriptional regulator [Phytohabitans flavus]BCB76699.1 TetR family transcriptional regulator [Phytohabitans flavus]
MSTKAGAGEAAETYRTQREVASQKHAAILEAAQALFAETQTVSLNEIAKRAGVGAGTLYRHFPTREHLILAVYQQELAKLVGSVDQVLAAEPTAKEAFAVWFEILAAHIRLKHGLGEALYSAAVRDAVSASYAPVTAAVSKLLDACVAEGSVRPGTDPADVLLLMGFLWRVPPTDEGVAQGRRLIEMVFDGIGAGGPKARM